VIAGVMLQVNRIVDKSHCHPAPPIFSQGKE
jgi:hypothetical protein